MGVKRYSEQKKMIYGSGLLKQNYPQKTVCVKKLKCIKFGSNLRVIKSNTIKYHFKNAINVH